MSECPVVIIDHFGAPTRLNESDFDPARHRLWRDPLDHDHDGRKGGSLKQDLSDDLAEARRAYAETFGKRPFHGWDAETLRKMIAEKAD